MRFVCAQCKCIQDKSPGLKEYDIIAIVPKSAAVAEQVRLLIQVMLVGNTFCLLYVQILDAILQSILSSSN